MSDVGPVCTPEAREAFRMVDKAGTARVATFVGAGFLVAAAAVAFLGSDVRWVLSLGCAFVGWVVAVGITLTTGLGSPRVPRHARPFGTGVLTAIVGGTGLGSMARFQAAAAASGELPAELRARADRSWRVCRFGAVATTMAGLLGVGGVLLAVAWVERESRSDHPADWYFMAPILAAVIGGWLVAAFNGAVGLICALMTPLSDD